MTLIQTVAGEPSVSPAAPSEKIILTPPPGPEPRINGARVFGVRPNHPFLFRVAAAGERPLEFSAEGLPDGVQLDARTGQITGKLSMAGEYSVLLKAKNRHGLSERNFKVVVGEEIALTPPMGWNSWNCFHGGVSASKVRQVAKAMVQTGLINHGWTYVNIDDAWQGPRGGKFNAIQGNDKFPDLKKLCDEIHAMGLKVGIYSTPWTTSYANHIGGSAENPEGTWEKPTLPKKGNINNKTLPWAIGKFSFARNDAQQWAEWGIDYLKYDWNPIEYPETKEMYDALRQSGRDVVLSLSNSTPFSNIPEIRSLANCWRTTGDIKANWESMSSKGFGQDKWRPYSGPGHWNDPDMLEIGNREDNQPGLTPDEEYTHMSLWCLLSAPLLMGHDLTKMDAFTLSLLTNDEVIDVNQDALGDQAIMVSSKEEGKYRVYAKKLEDGSRAVGLFNLASSPAKVSIDWVELGVNGSFTVRDLWRQKDVGVFDSSFTTDVNPHGVVLVRLTQFR